LETYGAVAMCYATVNYDVTADAEKPNVYEFNGKWCALSVSVLRLMLTCSLCTQHTSYSEKGTHSSCAER